ncbi:hypothetical protein PVAP13_2NG520900 [Panicum virgatum]|uniref:PGG domain-containing protein n=1 Tax=Panicum virgatum TaxID=38727 RepID=A0A8T0VMM8_PANVG|nr:hypothetical protein PVAP13_2NG520900 [Panicum virgatum]
MAEALAAPLEFGPEQMILSAELLQALTGGDAARLQELLSGEHRLQADGHVAINVNGASPGAAPPPSPQWEHGAAPCRQPRPCRGAELAAVVCEKAPSLAGHREVAARLLSTMRAGGADEAAALLARNSLGATALYEAVRHGHAGVVDLLMTEAPEQASLASEDGFSPLYLAASTDRSVKMVRTLLRRSHDGTPSPASVKGPEGRSALHVAATISKEMAQEILNWKPEGPTLLTKVDSSGRTPLQFAVMHGKLDVVQLFLDERTSMEQVHISDNRGLYAVHTAAMVGRAGIIDELIKKCPDYYGLVDDKGRNLLHCNTPLHLAVKHGFPRIVSLLLQTMTVETGVTNKYGLTAGDLGRRALAPGRWYYFLYWSRATITLDGIQTSYADSKHSYSFQKRNQLTGEETLNEEDDLARTGTIASVLIATVAFAAAFTAPGGFVADDHPGAGTAILARRFAFRAFGVSDTMAFLCSIIASCFFVYGGAREIPRNHRFWYNILGGWLVPIGALFMMATFAFGFHLVLGNANRWFIVFVYAVSLASVLLCFPSIWIAWDLGLWRAKHTQAKKPFSPEPWKAIVRCAYHLHHRHCTKYCSAKLLKHVSINCRLYCVMCGLIR